MAGETVRAFRSWFWRPPRPHGATVHDRQVSNLELFYDLVYVAVIGQAAHHLAEDVTVSAIAGFAVVFAMIWFAWMNGSLYLEIHGRQDGRTRTVVFLQMGILVVLAAFTAEATGESGGTFAVVYAVLFAVMGWLWYSVGGLDVAEYRTLTGVYVTGMVLSVVTALVSAVLPADLRLLVWAAFVVAWLVAIVAFGRMREFALAVTPTHSLVERFGQFTIIVLGEVIVGVVGGLADAMQDPITIATGLLGLFVGFGFWWSYFDIVGRRLPRAAGPANARWLLGHLPITMAIAGAGAAMTSLIVQAHEPTVSATTAWLIAGAVALGLVAIVPTSLALEDADRLPAVYRKIATTLVVGAGAALLAGWTMPAPWLLALLLSAVLVIVWLVAIGRFLGARAWSEVDAEAL
ncbi:MAG TPA: low temperature requirement protein A [Candidatus Limnocylindrales bacterium]|jgi:low temperature requirement protein LtrA|nr:low temperature requirement protein A [Candidatus Limnocylindrales bacterium]